MNLRLAVAWNIPVAGNRASADFLISPPLLGHAYDRIQPDFADYSRRGWSALATPADQVAWARRLPPAPPRAPSALPLPRPTLASALVWGDW